MRRRPPCCRPVLGLAGHGHGGSYGWYGQIRCVGRLRRPGRCPWRFWRVAFGELSRRSHWRGGPWLGPLSAVGVAAASESSASTSSVPVTTASMDIVFLLEGVVVRLRHIPPFASEAPLSERSDSGSGSGNGDVLGRRILLGGVAFGALAWRRSLLAAVGLV
ncbi:hypothetical protein BRADI_2g31793v3 [Brachypodium distachyon]|uniref:Uncharacterized protein n=1 Tax=Brachypodium distachyon TaxID=15368 RepID=A0A2K2DBE2_BRADI|nr:hypothetical protein BRADI_2g31793v3 [Brachypodium distachyon]